MTRLPAAEQRVPSGPLKIGDDWCGYFLRGDECHGQSIILEYAASKLDGPVAFHLRQLAAEPDRSFENSAPAG